MNYLTARQLPDEIITRLVNRVFIQGRDFKCRECYCDCSVRWWEFENERHAPECAVGQLIDEVCGRRE